MSQERSVLPILQAQTPNLPGKTLGMKRQICEAARVLGFSKVAFAPLGGMERGERALRCWIDQNYHGEMAYMTKHGNRSDPTKMLLNAQSVITVALPYAKADVGHQQAVHSDGRGYVARFARGADYHIVLKKRLQRLAEFCTTIVGRPVMARPCVDSAPLLEREYAHRSGLAFIAKNTMAIVPGVGSYVLLGELVVDFELPPDKAETSRCGSCQSCLDACPTQAFADPYLLDARRCISYLSIEFKGVIPRELRPLMGTHVFGCDICQQVCPFNHSPKPYRSDPELAAHKHLIAPLLTDLLNMSSGSYRRFVRGTALRRLSRNQLARNAAIALGNGADRSVVPALCTTLEKHSSALVRTHVAWALGTLGGEASEHALEQCVKDTQENASVREEAWIALQDMSKSATTGA